MKKTFLSLLLAAFTISSFATVTLDADLKAALPSGKFFLPAPPEVGSLIWLDDSITYYKYKKAAHENLDANGDRWDSIWAKLNEQYYFALYRLAADSVMNAPFIDVTWERKGINNYTAKKNPNTTDFPNIYALEQLCEQMKSDNTSNLWRTRPRPYKYFGEWYGSTHYDPRTASSDSYPSGHGYFAGLFGMCMMYIDPDNAQAIKAMMDEWMECRLWVGAHWKTDLSAGWQLGAIAFSIAMNYDQFRNLVEDAKKELANYRAAHPEPTPAPAIGDNNTTEELNTFLSAHNGETLPELSITRPVAKNMYNTLCLPFSMDAEQIAASSLNGVQIHEFTNAVVADDELYLYVSEPINAIQAGKPYFVQYDATTQLEELNFTNVTISNTNPQKSAVNINGVEFRGTFVPFAMSAQEAYTTDGGYLFLDRDNQLYWPNTDGTIKPFRAYFYVNTSSAPAEAPMHRNMKAHLGKQEQTPTGDGTIQGGTPEAAKIIKRGAVYIIKGNEKYDVQGKLID